MTDFQITDADLSRSKFEGKVALVTGNLTIFSPQPYMSKQI